MTSKDAPIPEVLVTCDVASARRGVPLVLNEVRTEESVRRRLAQLGLRPGADIQVLRVTAGGGRIVAVAGSRIALDRATATCLLAQERTTT
ncbi:MAG: FeoA family protein [Dermatophilaceae bacterium]